MPNESHHVCPWWVGYFLINPLRKLSEDPEKIFTPYIKPGMTVIDYGCAMGYFSLPLAKMTGPSGKVRCFDIQERMLKKLGQRARKRNLQFVSEAKAYRQPPPVMSAPCYQVACT